MALAKRTPKGQRNRSCVHEMQKCILKKPQRYRKVSFQWKGHYEERVVPGTWAACWEVER